MGAPAFNINNLIESTTTPDILDSRAAVHDIHNINDQTKLEHTTNEHHLLKERIELLEKKNEQLVSSVNFLFQLLSQIQGTISKKQPLKENIAPLSIPAQSKPLHSGKETTPILTRRELAVFDLLSEGLCAKEIACKLGISQNTVISHKKNLKAKFNAKNSAELISTMLRNRMSS